MTQSFIADFLRCQESISNWQLAIGNRQWLQASICIFLKLIQALKKKHVLKIVNATGTCQVADQPPPLTNTSRATSTKYRAGTNAEIQRNHDGILEIG